MRTTTTAAKISETAATRTSGTVITAAPTTLALVAGYSRSVDRCGFKTVASGV